ncbi:uncharacterized protein MYCFIDRAFT_173399 [Pseudocercospora fijiensis CIRAD86]|uniref:Uncharacterized protein n=1 Tax=Pseudocercospora fijiensis (strain CIRAD86) TaxID=383855 RepID=M3AIH2_PSEFD|nr:uncharacterized protein MYCFIDRAFT_173399 [Pseudocercospora fijiensis CIRAD86]EME84396.1 hypothetical protein MYCFIDRAFT_173399 [Pseudocercospora fijiensis CIRAD86]
MAPGVDIVASACTAVYVVATVMPLKHDAGVSAPEHSTRQLFEAFAQALAAFSSARQSSNTLGLGLGGAKYTETVAIVRSSATSICLSHFCFRFHGWRHYSTLSDLLVGSMLSIILLFLGHTWSRLPPECTAPLRIAYALQRSGAVYGHDDRPYTVLNRSTIRYTRLLPEAQLYLRQTEGFLRLIFLHAELAGRSSSDECCCDVLSSTALRPPGSAIMIPIKPLEQPTPTPALQIWHELGHGRLPFTRYVRPILALAFTPPYRSDPWKDSYARIPHVLNPAREFNTRQASCSTQDLVPLVNFPPYAPKTVDVLLHDNAKQVWDWQGWVCEHAVKSIDACATRRLTYMSWLATNITSVSLAMRPHNYEAFPNVLRDARAQQVTIPHT